MKEFFNRCDQDRWSNDIDTYTRYYKMLGNKKCKGSFRLTIINRINEIVDKYPNARLFKVKE